MKNQTSKPESPGVEFPSVIITELLRKVSMDQSQHIDNFRNHQHLIQLEWKSIKDLQFLLCFQHFYCFSSKSLL